MDTRAGCVLAEAIERFADRAVLDAFHTDRRTDGGEYWSILDVMWNSLKAKLLAGELIATGFFDSLTAQLIPRDAWRFLECRTPEDLKDSVVSGNGIRVAGVLVQEPSREQRRDAEAEFKQWLIQRKRDGGPSPTRASLFDDARRLFPQLTKEAFLRVWRKVAPASWKKPGRRKSTG